MKIQANLQNNQNFNAKILSQWKCSNTTGKFRNVSIIDLEKRDLKFINKFFKDLHKFNHLDEIRKDIINSSINTIKTILENTTNNFKKTKMLLAIQNGKPCGILIANIPKQQSNSEKVLYSSRHNPAKNETELDWLVTWNPSKNENIKNVGKALMGEFFKSLKSDKLRDVFVKSEIPEYSYAVNFYESVGFEKLGNKRTKLSNKNSGQCIIDNYSDSNDSIIPMIITSSKIQTVYEDLSKKLCRQEFVQKSIDINDLIE